MKLLLPTKGLSIFSGKLDSPMEVEDMLSLTLYEDGCGFYCQFYPYSLLEEDVEGYDLAEEGEMLLCLYGIIENLSSQKFDINDVIDVEVLIDDVYEYEGMLRLENEDETDLASTNTVHCSAEMDKRIHISKEEQKKCKRVAEAFAELYEIEDILVLDAGNYGYVKLQYYRQSGFEENVLFTDSRSLFENLWEEWLHAQIFHLAEGTAMLEMAYEDIFHCLQEEKQKEILDKKAHFAKIAGMEI